MLNLISTRYRRFAGVAIALSAATALSGCAKDQMSTGSVNRQTAAIGQMSPNQLAGAINSLGAAYEKDPANKATGLAFANALQADGRNDQALAVMKKLAIEHSKDREVLAAYGKALAGVGELPAALDAVRRAQTPERPDWKLLSAEGAILDQMGDSASAREQYRKALDIFPNEPNVLSNLGMSYVLEGDLKTAETYLRNAIAQPGADNRVRQNLAMVIGLQGRFDEAEQIATQSLPPQQAQANIAYLRSIMAQQNTWADIEGEGKKKPKS
ncbi:MAG: tetratricopeptide repeat protein [Notoacmeibacter sp.]